MSTTIFQKYLEGMNGQPLEKKPDSQCSSVLLPHQRTSPIKKAVPHRESIVQTPNNIRNGQTVYATPCKDVPAPVSNISTTTGLLHNKERSPENNRGLAASRWNDQSCQDTPMNKTGYLATPSHRAHKQPRVMVEESSVAASRVDKNMYQTPVKKPLSLVSYEAVTQKSALNASDRQNGSFCFSPQDEVNRVADDGKNELNDVKSRAWDLSHRPSAVLPVVADPEANIKVTALSPQVGAQIVEDWKVGDTIRDPRGKWPTELSVWDQVKQDMVDQDQESIDEVASSTDGQEAIPQHATSFIKTWIMGAHDISTNFLSQDIENHADCDVDTFSGVLLSPIEQPRTKIDGLMSCSQAVNSSTSYMKEFLAKTAHKQKAQRKTEKQVRVTTGASEAETRSMVAEHPNLNEVQFPCHLRPATESDIQNITAIYNREVSEGYKVMDTKPIRPDDFHTIYKRCQVERMPFVVAVEGYHGVTDQKIIGVALVTEVSLGIAGSLETLSSRGGKLLVIVEPEYRRKKVGTALIDLIITNCTGWYVSKCGCQFVNYTHDWISNEFGRNPRRWWYLEMEVMILSGDNEETTRKGEEFQWIWNFLEAKFDMMLKHYDEKCYYDPRKMNWLDKLTFRRVCRTLGE
ncbi:hypothetical protein FHL15_004224 [Xylaria flabelliformis]|uniref:N-acetyltransferase domain-containing protein n=1 Tax=Xylaria flabelliformis TaxID=2512241 RepID=A0A553I3J7_9PEZI|nr:hypothetical protein FHL15_004224 [Xylaria flabelliformis]